VLRKRRGILRLMQKNELIRIRITDLNNLGCGVGHLEDAAQDTFLKAYQKCSSFRGECSEKTWLMRIAINTCRDYQRRAWLRRTDQSVDVERLVLPGGTPADGRDDTVIRAVMALPGRDREVVLLRYYQQMKLDEISRALGVPQGTVTSRLNRARNKLRRQLEGWYFDEEF